MKVNKEQIRAIHKAVDKIAEQCWDINIDSECDTFSEWMDFMKGRYKIAFETLWKLIEEIEYYELS